MANDSQYTRGVAKLSQRIKTIRANIDLPDLTADIGALLLRRTKDRFNREIDPDYVRWQELAPLTLLRKRQGGYADKGKLKRTEQLFKSIHIIKGRVTGSVFTNTGASLRIGIDDPNEVEKAAAQNYGTPRIPARRFLGIGRLDVKAVDGLMRRRAAKLEASS